MHGQLSGALCPRCAARWEAPLMMGAATPCPACSAPARPDVVWFGEMPYQMEPILEAIAGADLFVAIGTSGTVYPAAGFAAEAQMAGAETLEINLEASGGGFDRVILGPASRAVPEWVAGVLSGRPGRGPRG